MAKITVRHIAEMKQRGEKIPMITAYDYTTAVLADAAEIPIVLVGDSLGMVVLGHESTIPVTMDDIIHHTKMVARGNKNSLIVADLPFMTYQVDPSEALRNAARLLQEGGAHTVKLEGGENIAPTVRRIVQCDIPVMGHVGVTPQSVNAFGGYRVRGRTAQQASQIVKDALALEEAGAYAVVLELVPAPLSRLISEKLTVPTIGIGAGPDCDGQVQVLHDMLGLFTDFVPRHAKQYANLGQTIRDAFCQYAQEVKDGSFPTTRESFTMDEAILAELEDL
ncbi:3-methyl-2-oxobutanoate hydroxymethyltransferase [Geodia barretti]|uniref:3-methyl-2-oxobutanoate hydroxymethyltransferase n=4 Tax=Geodia barretti TaxID=519541 RepID=A0AA35RSY6_GEOBA|nr:3-methyl-2-oxobutanoate hydroxymethyltransferase [Geodia barretti]